MAVRRRILWGIVGSCLLLTAAGAAAWLAWRHPEQTPALRGQAIARRLGCFGCHGPEGLGGTTDPTAPAGRVPGWDLGTVEMYVTSEEQIREWILDGQPRSDPPRGHRPGSAPLVPMPAYREQLSDGELGDLVAYFLAVSGFAPDIPDDAYEGGKIASRLGCLGCHGPSGMGGVPNPGSLKGHIPPWDGQEFAQLVRNDQELREWILDGKIERLQKNPAARYFLEAQKTRMPAYRDYISDDELNKLVSYVHWLRSR